MSPGPKIRKHAVFAAVTLLIAAGAALGGAELLLRIAAPQPVSWLDIYRRHPQLPFYTLQPGKYRLVDTGETRWTVYTDGQGYRTGKAAHADRGDPRPLALVLGDSFTFAHGVDHEESFVGQLEALEAAGYRYLNAAVPGYGPVQYRQVLQYELDVLGRRPQLVVIGTFLGNDIHDCMWSKDVPVNDGVTGDEGDLKSYLKRHAHLYRLASRAYHVLVPNREDDQAASMDDLYDAQQWAPGGKLHGAAETYRRELTAIAELARTRSFGLLVAILPARPTVEARRSGRSRPGFDDALPLERVRALLRELDIHHADLTPSLAAHPTEQVYFTYDGHLTALGHRVVTDVLQTQIKAMSNLAELPKTLDL
jgi:hypothetical protein